MVKESSRSLRAELQEVIDNLKALPSTLAVAVSALREQNADIDADVASLLQRTVSHPLQDQIQKLEALLRHLPAPPSRKR
jgi:ABC-type transporter Mla subunit MlaD